MGDGRWEGGGAGGNSGRGMIPVGFYFFLLTFYVVDGWSLCFIV